MVYVWVTTAYSHINYLGNYHGVKLFLPIIASDTLLYKTFSSTAMMQGYLSASLKVTYV